MQPRGAWRRSRRPAVPDARPRAGAGAQHGLGPGAEPAAAPSPLPGVAPNSRRCTRSRAARGTVAAAGLAAFAGLVAAVALPSSGSRVPASEPTVLASGSRVLAESSSCDRTASPASFASELSAAAAGQTICLASGDYGTWEGTDKAITVKAAAGAAPAMRVSFAAGAEGASPRGHRRDRAGRSRRARSRRRFTIRDTTVRGLTGRSTSRAAVAGISSTTTVSTGRRLGRRRYGLEVSSSGRARLGGGTALTVKGNDIRERRPRRHPLRRRPASSSSRTLLHESLRPRRQPHRQHPVPEWHGDQDHRQLHREHGPARRRASPASTEGPSGC